MITDKSTIQKAKDEIERQWTTQSTMNKERSEFFWKGVDAGITEFINQLHKTILGE